MANRVANDMGGLIYTVSRTWFSLPPEKKQNFRSRLRKQHQLMVTDEKIPVTNIIINNPFIPKLEKSLLLQTGQIVTVKQDIKDKRCLWVSLSEAEQTVTIGFFHDRIGPRPSIVILGIIAAGSLLILITTILLVRRITQPIKTLSNAVSLFGSGDLSTRIPEKGSEEIVILAHNFNNMALEISQLLTNRNILFGGISHDLRTPITRMQIALELLQNDSNSTLISKMRNNLLEMETLIQQSLELVKGLDKHNAIDVEINTVINDIILDYKSQQQVIHYRPADCGICNIEINAFRRILYNLLDNAIRYSDNKVIAIICIKKNEKLVIRILDQGTGIPADKLEMVFQPFYRLDNSRNKGTGGSGLGLAIVKQLCDIYGWNIQLIPRLKGGLEVKLEIIQNK
ncbi:MAG: ATP-binding protein [Methylococcaceae bacterium]|nr:ATP-binding protein [Methylococcaceae bacterium]